MEAEAQAVAMEGGADEELGRGVTAADRGHDAGAGGGGGKRGKCQIDQTARCARSLGTDSRTLHPGLRQKQAQLSTSNRPNAYTTVLHRAQTHPHRASLHAHEIRAAPH
jgi:hypothetical protein